jgi:hypothetical protein
MNLPWTMMYKEIYIKKTRPTGTSPCGILIKKEPRDTPCGTHGSSTRDRLGAPGHSQLANWSMPSSLSARRPILLLLFGCSFCGSHFSDLNLLLLIWLVYIISKMYSLYILLNLIDCPSYPSSAPVEELSRKFDVNLFHITCTLVYSDKVLLATPFVSK